MHSNAPSGSYPPSVYSPPAAKTHAIPPATLVWWAGAMTFTGLLTGILWWLAAPGGAFYGDETLPETWLMRDLTLAGLELAVGVVVGWLLVQRMDLPGAWQRVCAAVAGSIAGSLLALGTGQWLGMLWGPEASPDATGEAFLLRSFGVLAIWPAAASLVVFLSALLSLAGRRE